MTNSAALKTFEDKVITVEIRSSTTVISIVQPVAAAVRFS